MTQLLGERHAFTTVAQSGFGHLSSLLLPFRSGGAAALQVYLAKWRETLVAVKILMNTGVDIEDADDAERALTLSNPILMDLEKVGGCDGHMFSMHRL